MRPLEGLVVLDFSQFLAGPVASLRMADLGARVIKIERPGTGDICRQLYISDVKLAGESTLFHSINRNKQSFAADLKKPDDLARVKQLITRADVMIQNFRPGVIERLGLDYGSVSAINPRLVYGSISGYGDEGPWKDKPGQDLLAQALSGLMWLSGNGGEDAPPVPMGLSVADMFAGHFLTQGVLASLVRRGVTGRGGLVEVSLLEALLDFQFEVLTTHLNDGGRVPQRSLRGGAHAYLAAPYGVYQTADGWLAIAMNSLDKLAGLLGLPELVGVPEAETFMRRDELKATLADLLGTRPTRHWLDLLEAHDVWCAEVMDWPGLLEREAFKVLRMTQRVTTPSGATFIALRCPVRIDRERLYCDRGASDVGEDNDAILADLID